MKTPLTEHHKAELRLECVKIVAARDQARGARADTKTIAEDAEPLIKLVLDE